MTDLMVRNEVYRSSNRYVTGRQPYHLELPGAANAKDLSVVSFKLTEGMCVPYEITIEVTHPEQLTRADYLGRDAHFTIDAEDSATPRLFRGILVKLNRTKKTKDEYHYTFVIRAQIDRLNLLQASVYSSTRRLRRS